MIICIRVAHGHPEACLTCGCEGRPVAVSEPAPYETPTAHCMDCGAGLARGYSARCRPCEGKRRSLAAARLRQRRETEAVRCIDCGGVKKRPYAERCATCEVLMVGVR